MWIDKEIIPALIDAVEITLKNELKAQESEGFDPDNHYDPNDLVIFESFVLTVLKENRNYGFYSSEMLYKGFGFMVGLVAWYLNTYGDKLSDSCFGLLARLHYTYYIKESLSYLGYIEPEYIKENIDNINRYIDRGRLTVKPRQRLNGVVIPLRPVPETDS